MFGLLAKVFIKWLTYERKPTGLPLCDFERIRYEVRPCDVLLVEGRSKVADIIKSVTHSAWSHTALYIGRIHDIEDPEFRTLLQKYYDGPPDAQLLIEGLLGYGTVINPISVYKNDHIRICRPRGISPSDSQKVIDYAISRLGTGYDSQHIFDLYRLMIPWNILPRRFRSKIFNIRPGQTTKTVCSSIIAEAFINVDFPILPAVAENNKKKRIEFVQRNPRLYVPSDFDYSPYFEIIKYPFIDVTSPYRHLPWNREGLISNDNEQFTQLSDEEHQLLMNPAVDTISDDEDEEFLEKIAIDKNGHPLHVPFEEEDNSPAPRKDTDHQNTNTTDDLEKKTKTPADNDKFQSMQTIAETTTKKSYPDSFFSFSIFSSKKTNKSISNPK